MLRVLRLLLRLGRRRRHVPAAALALQWAALQQHWSRSCCVVAEGRIVLLMLRAPS
jgi:hypothetical protein